MLRISGGLSSIQSVAPSPPKRNRRVVSELIIKLGFLSGEWSLKMDCPRGIASVVAREQKDIG